MGELGFAGEGVEVGYEGGEDLKVAGGGGEGLVERVYAGFVLGLHLMSEHVICAMARMKKRTDL